LFHVGNIVITNKCNFTCDFCYAHKNEDPNDAVFSLDYIKKLKTKIPKESFSFASITGGEPLLYKDLVKQVRAEFGQANILTNGSLIDEEFVKWMLDSNTSVYITLDYDIPNFSGHASQPVRQNLQRLVDKYPDLVNFMSLGTVMPIHELYNLNDYRSTQCEPFEKECWKLFNFIFEGEYVKEDFFEQELDRLENDEISIKETLFFRYLNYLQKAFGEGFNTSSCSNSLSINHRGQIYACHEYAAMPESFSSRFKPIFVDDFDLDKFKDHLKEVKYGPNSLCKKDCCLKYLCGGVCWANLHMNDYLCVLTRLAVAYALYIKVNYIPNNKRLASCSHNKRQ